MKFKGLVAALALAGCVSTKVQSYGTVDQTEKTITVPTGGFGLTGKIKSKLTSDGWILAVYQGPTLTTGSAGQNTSLSTSDTFNTRYRLLIDWEQFDLCINLQAAVAYDISLIDNKTGSEVVTMSGAGCADDVASQFVKLVGGN